MDIGLIVDLETTGLSSETDKIIEIGILQFEIKAGSEPIITNMYSGLEDPGEALTPEIVKITGLNDEVLAGKKINWALVKEFFDESVIAVAHNMEFDAGFLVKRPELEPLDIHWTCSQKHIQWQKHGFRTRALNYLAADHGFVNPFAHRALFDCGTTFRLVAPYINEMIEKSYEREYVLQAVGSPFETKDILRTNGYRWDASSRFWHKSVFECDLDQERTFLAENVYSGKSKHVEHEILPRFK